MKKIKAIALLCIGMVFACDLSAQNPDLLHGDNLNFSYGVLGWRGRGGAYHQNTTSTNPVWGWHTVYADILNAKDNKNANLFTLVTDTNAVDPYSNGQLKQIPTHLGFTRSLKIKNTSTNSNPDCAEASYSIAVDEDNCLLTVCYAVVLQAPGHTGYENPPFQLDIVTSEGGNDVQINDCAFFEMNGRTPIPADSPFQVGTGASYDQTIFCPWQQVKINLANYIGETVSIRLRTGNCSPQGHFGYAYICARAEKPTIEVAGCAGEGNVITTATAPDGFQSYKWFRVNRSSVSQASMENLEPADDSFDILSTNRVLTITEDMMQNQTTQFFAVKLISPRTQNTRPNCVAYIKATVNDIRPNFNAVTYIPVDPMNELDEVGFNFADVVQRTEATPLQWQKIVFGDGDSVSFTKDANNIWSPEGALPAGTRVTTNPATQNIDVVYHVYAPGTYTAKRYATSSFTSEDEDGASSTIYCTRKQDIEVIVHERPSLHIDGADTVCVGANDTLYASSPDNAPELAATYTYYWWNSIDDIDSDPAHTGPIYVLTDVRQTVDVVVKVVDQNNFYRFAYFSASPQDFPDISLEGDTMLCLGQSANITASDATGNTVAMQWSFVDPGNNPHITDPSTTPNLSFTPTQDTIVYLICKTSVGCLAYKSINILITDPKVSSDKSKICPLQEVVLTGSNAVDYSWTSDPVDPSLTTDVRSADPVTVTPAQTTTYTMKGYGSSGCFAERQVTVTVIPKPTPSIAYSPEYVDTEDPVVSFSDASPYGAYSLWKFSDGGQSNDRVLKYLFHDLSVDSVTVYLKTANEVGADELNNDDYNCSADTSITLPVELFAVWVPNAFTPNDDGQNDYFFFLTNNRLEEVSFEVYNRWGTKVYSFEAPQYHIDPQEQQNTLGWDGKYKDKFVSPGVYVWKMSYKRQGNTRVYRKEGTVAVVK